MKTIHVVDDAVRHLLVLKTQELQVALGEQQKAMDELIVSLQKYMDWLEEEIVRLEGEK